MSIIMSTTKTAPAAVTIMTTTITIMPMKSSPAGALKLLPTYTTEEVEGFLKELDNEEKYGIVLRAKGMIPAADGTWIYFDYVPEESNVRAGKPDVTG